MDRKTIIRALRCDGVAEECEECNECAYCRRMNVTGDGGFVRVCDKRQIMLDAAEALEKKHYTDIREN